MSRDDTDTNINVILDANALADNRNDHLELQSEDRVSAAEVGPSGSQDLEVMEAGDGDPSADFSIEEAAEQDLGGSEEEVHVTLQPATATKDYYFQKYKEEWEELPEFKGWLRPVADDVYKAECLVCKTHLRCHKLKLRQHAKSRKHHLNMVSGSQRLRTQAKLMTLRKERRSFGRRVGGTSTGMGRGGTPTRRVAAREQAPRSADQQDVSYGDMGRVTYSIGLGGNKVGFIGAGTIAQAIARAILDKGVIHSGRMTVAAPSARNLSRWSGWGSAVTNSNDLVVQACHVVFLCVPPAVAVEVLHALAPNPQIGERCFISVVPGLGRERIESILASKFVPPCAPGDVQTLGSVYVVRCMVNLAVRTGAGCCAYSVPANLPDSWLLCLEVMCGAMGVSQPLDDARLDAFSAAVSAGPAMALAFCEALTMGAANVGLPWNIARKMAAQTLVGAGHLLLDADSPATLSEQAAPPGDPGLSALMALQRTDMRSGVAAAVQAFQRAVRNTFGE
ncbi:Pyrroline-5-carboxylate reductase 3 [Amphibalanus amphitrite]|uniref:Pyrroline-5-carboxylate reductase 3 n=1 Tax=Amphibalanus amphitrite TaxID=1232801 RepID=A0A6A4WDZ1_AMPAM|nr:Pyrroline-5-carboxylate reductase 3 [Amphibalanus amphitrite]